MFDPLRTMGDWFIGTPTLAIVPGVLFLLLYLARRRRLVLAAGVAWLIYAVYELGMEHRVLCSGECDIRVDLLAIYPLLLLLSLAALVALVWPRRTRPLPPPPDDTLVQR
ncbi:MAG TPA: hypothetical protein VFJ74_01490 [Gemmatimonadaceae bacterium]|nr:hypothetical protein [Gemmatimonadaceae bacterium]